MAARPGEDLAATLFADIHYFYGAPTAKPPHHRFDKGSYVYLFENASQRRARIEIANNAGTPEQDAFNGYLDSTHVQYSYRHTTLVTLTVDGQNAQRDSVAPDTREWHLPTFDPKNENKYMYRLHTVDIYFWTKEDALSFMGGVRRVLPQQQITIQDEPVAPPPHKDDMSPVVQKLENVAITDPTYQQGRTRDSRTTTTGFAGPPMSALPNTQGASHFSPQGFQPTPPPAQETAAFAPLAYNPAAPAAPETIQYREKTPPPEDGAPNPLMTAAASDQGQTYGVPFHQPGGFSGLSSSQSQSQQSYFPGPPGPPAGPPPTASQPQSQSPYAQHFQHSFAAPPTVPTSTPPAYKAQPSPHVPVTQQFANYPGSPGISPGMSTPGIYSPGFVSPQQSSQNPSNVPSGGYNPGAPPPGGFAQFDYGQGTGQKPVLSNTQPLTTDWSIHQQVYRPTVNEASTKHHEKPTKAPTGKLEQRADRLERGMTGLFKKLEKKIG